MLYISTFFIFSILSYRELFAKRTKDSSFYDCLFACLCILYLFVLTSIRGGETGDYVTYKETYLGIDTSTLDISSFGFEPLYSLLQWLCKFVTDNFQIFLLLIGSFVILLETRYAKSFCVIGGELTVVGKGHGRRISNDSKAKNKPLGDYFFTCLLILWALYHANIFVIRSTIAIIICLCSTKFILKKKFWRFLICVLLAFGFHYSALCFLPAYWIYHFRSRLLWKLIIVCVLSILFSLIIEDVLLLIGQLLGGSIQSKISNYLAGGFTEGVGTALESKGIILLGKAAINIGFMIGVGIYLWKPNKRNSYFEGTFNLYLFGCILYLTTLSFSYAFARISLYYNIFQVPLLLFLFEKKRRKEKQTVWLLLGLYLLTRMLVNLATNNAFNFITFFE